MFSVTFHHCLCVGTETVSLHSGLPLSHWWGTSHVRGVGKTCGYCCTGETYSQDKTSQCEKEAGVQLHRDGGTKRWQFVCNSMDTVAQGEWEWDLFATERRDRSPFCPFVSPCVPWLCHPMCSRTIVMASFRSGHHFPPINGNPSFRSFIQFSSYLKVSGSLTCTEER